MTTRPGPGPAAWRQRLAKGSESPSDIQIQYRSLQELCADIKTVLHELFLAQKTAKELMSRMNEMRNAVPEMMLAMTDMQRKFAFTFRDHRESNEDPS